MDHDERSVRLFLKSFHGQFVSGKVISRRLGGRRRFEEDPLWVMPLLNRMLEKGILETDPSGHYRLVPPDRTVKVKRTWMSPNVKRILARSSRDFSQVVSIDDEEEDEELEK